MRYFINFRIYDWRYYQGHDISYRKFIRALLEATLTPLKNGKNCHHHHRLILIHTMRQFKKYDDDDDFDQSLNGANSASRGF